MHGVLKSYKWRSKLQSRFDSFCFNHMLFECWFCVVGGYDPLFCQEPFLALEPLSHSEFNFSLDTAEGVADLFDLI